MLSTQHDLETHESNIAARSPVRQLPEAQATALPFYVGLALIVVAFAYCLLGGTATPSWRGVLVTGLSTSIGVGLMLVVVTRLHLERARLYQHVGQLHFDLLGVEHKLFLSHARCIDLEAQLLRLHGAKSDAVEEVGLLKLEVQRSAEHRAAVRMLARGAQPLAVLVASAMRTLGRHPKSVVAKSRVRDGIAAVQLCIAMVDELVGSDADDAEWVLRDFAMRLAMQCDRADLSSDVWEIARGLIAQAHEFRDATAEGNEQALIDRWLYAPHSPAQPAGQGHCGDELQRRDAARRRQTELAQPF